MRYLLIILFCGLLFSCSNSFINHELKSERIGDCSDQATPVKMVSNINGERYEFHSCIDDGFDGKNYSITRVGDSIIVNFPRTVNKKHAEYNLVLDIDAKPNYHHIILDGQELTIVPAEK